MADPDIQLMTPASEKATTELHRNLVAAGQALTEDEMPSFLLVVNNAAGHMTAGCKGEITFQTAHVSKLWVADSLRGKGVGTRLLQAAEDHARREDCTRLHLETRSEAARKLYERLGYAVFGKLPNYDGTLPFYYLVKDLS